MERRVHVVVGRPFDLIMGFSDFDFLPDTPELLPLFICRPFARRRQGCAMYINNSFPAFRHVRIIAHNHNPISLFGNWVFGNFA
jgi:hypothetical protein